MSETVPPGPLSRWLPPALLLLLIVLTLPLGQVTAMILYRLADPDIQATLSLPADDPVVAVSANRGPVVLATQSGQIQVLDAQGERTPLQAQPTPDTRCRDLAARGNTVACAAGPGGVWIQGLGQEAGTRQTHPDAAGATLVDFSGRLVLSAHPDGRLDIAQRPDTGDRLRALSQLELGFAPTDLVLADGRAVVVGLPDQLRIIDLSTPDQPRVVAELRLPGPPTGAALERTHAFVAIGAAGLAVVGLADPARPALLATVPLPSPAIGVSVSNRDLVYGLTQAHGAVPIHTTHLGHWWARTPLGIEGELRWLTGSYKRHVGITTTGQITWFDNWPTRDELVWAVGALFALGVALLGLQWRRSPPPALPRRIAWMVLAIAAGGAVLGTHVRYAIEAFHVLEYAALGGLAYRALRTHGDGWAPALSAVAAAALAGLVDETVQWSLPMRSGDLADVGLDARAGAIGVLIAWKALSPGTPIPPAQRPLGAARLGIWVAAAVAGMAAFQHAFVGFGHLHPGPGQTQFYSRLPLPALVAQDQDHGAAHAKVLEGAANLHPSEFMARYPAAQHPFLYELRIHLLRRDRRFAQQDLPVACAEAQIVQSFFGNSVSGTSFEWTQAHWDACSGYEGPYMSAVSEDLLVRTGPVGLWSAVGAVCIWALAGVAFARRKSAFLALLAGLMLASPGLSHAQGALGDSVRIDTRDARAQKILNQALTDPKYWDGANISTYTGKHYDKIGLKKDGDGYVCMVTGESDKDYANDVVSTIVFKHMDRLPRHLDGAKAVVTLGQGTDPVNGLPYKDSFYFVDLDFLYTTYLQRIYHLKDGQRTVLFYETLTQDMVDAATWAAYQQKVEFTKDKVDRRIIFNSIVEIDRIYGMYVVEPGKVKESRVTFVTRVEFSQNAGWLASVGSKMPGVLRAGLKGAFNACVRLCELEKARREK